MAVKKKLKAQTKKKSPATSGKKKAASRKKDAPKKAAAPVKKSAARKPAAKKAAVKKAAKPKKAPSAKKKMVARAQPKPPKQKAAPKKTAPVAAVKKVAPPAAAKKSGTSSSTSVPAAPKYHPLTASEIGRFRASLETKRTQIVVDLSKNRDANLETSEEGIQDIADKASSSYTREFLYSLSDTERQNLALIDAALDRIIRGTFAICVACGNPLNRARLEAVPWARHCLTCQELQERGLLSS